MKTDIIIFATAAILLTTTTACNEDENDDTNITEEDATSDLREDSEEDAALPDTSTTDTEDTTDSSDTTPDSDAVADTGETSEDAVVTSCSDEEYAAAVNEALAPQTAPASSDLITFATNEGVDEATVEAGLGGIANAPSSSWIYLDIDAAEQINLGDVDALDDNAWDIAFKRTSIRLNSGDSGPGPWMLTKLTETTWEDAAVPGRDSGAEWSTDEFVDDETCEVFAGERTGIETAFGQWYAYDMATHTVGAPEDTIFVLYNSTTHQTRRLEIQSYDDGTYELRWAAFPTAGE